MRRSLATRAAAAAHSRFFLCALAAMLSLAVPLSPLRAAFNVTGDVEPASPTTWTSYTSGYVGNTADGTLTVDSGNLLSSSVLIGANSGVAGTVTLTGTGSTWTYGPYSSLYVGNYGSGTLNISGGAAVSNGYRVHRLLFRLDRCGDGQRRRLDMDQLIPICRQLWQRDAEHHWRRHCGQFRRLHWQQC